MTRWIARILLVASLAFLGWAGWTYWQAGGGDSPADRAAALATGTRAVAVLNTLDHTSPQTSVDQWLAITSGPLHDQLGRDGAKASTTSATGTVVAAALSSYDGGTRTARLIASVNVELTPAKGAPSVQRQRFEAQVTKVGSDWKLTSLTAVPVGAR
ncbi:hypothetical protein [Actinocorallia longicatena]|uniref:Mce-associated membrane protein n=1 Tax=Actinocorallia longicatena TaxID=111803 RepID=A0ABP6QLU1_9ACTN